MAKLYALKSDYGYGDWSIVERNLTEQEAITLFNDRNRSSKTSIDEVEYNHDYIYYIVDNNEEDNDNWEDS